MHASSRLIQNELFRIYEWNNMGHLFLACGVVTADRGMESRPSMFLKELYEKNCQWARESDINVLLWNWSHQLYYITYIYFIVLTFQRRSSKWRKCLRSEISYMAVHGGSWENTLWSIKSKLPITLCITTLMRKWHTIMLQGALHVNHYHQQIGSKWGSIAAQDVIHAHITYRMTPE